MEGETQRSGGATQVGSEERGDVVLQVEPVNRG
jgi:hypothetical protein